MLNGKMAGLRARHDSDIPILEAELYDDVDVSLRTDPRPWRPVPPGSAASRYRVTDPAVDPACFSVLDLATGELAGGAILWGGDPPKPAGPPGKSARPPVRR